MNKIKIGKNSWGAFRMNSNVSMIAILIACAVNYTAELFGMGNEWWVWLIILTAFAILIIDGIRALIALTPRKRWERVMYMGFAIGAGLLICTIFIEFDETTSMKFWFTTVGIASILAPGIGGYILWRRAVKELNSKLLERRLKDKKFR